VYAGELEQKICDLLSSGIVVTINSDDPAYLGGYINKNFAYVAQIAGLGPGELAELAKNSFRASFISEDQKKLFMDEVDAALQDWQQEHEAVRHGQSMHSHIL
jgi:adenosine deaminase